MPVILDSSEIKVIDGDKNFTIETVKSNVIVNQDTVINEPTITAPDVYVVKTAPITEDYPVLEADATNLVAHYKFDDSSSLGLDSNPSTTKYNLTPTIVGGTGGYDALNGVFDASFQATNDGDYLDGNFPSKTLYDASASGITISCWFYKKSGTTYDNQYGTSLYSMYNPSVSGQALNVSTGHHNGTHALNFSFQYLGSGQGETYCSGWSAGLALETWHNVVISLDNNGYINGYLNGVNQNLITGTTNGTIRWYNSCIYPVPTFPNATKLRIFALSSSKFSGNTDDFRIYDKALSEEEIVILYNDKVKLEITPVPPQQYTEERMYPPTRDLASASHLISGESYGNGVYETSESDKYGTTLHGYSAFNTSMDTGPHFNNKYTNGVYNGSDYIVPGYLGDWIKIKLPRPIKLTKYGFKQRLNYLIRAPGKYKLYGSNDGTNWDVLVHKITTVSYTQQISFTNDYFEENINVNNQYQYFGLVANQLYGNEQYFNFDEWYIYGKEFISEDPEYKTLAFTYEAVEDLLIDFEPYNTQSTWTNYINSLQTDGFVQSYDLNYILNPGYTNAVFKSNVAIGYIDFIIPSGYDSCDITYGREGSDDPAQIKINDIDVDSTNENLKTYTATNLVSGQIIRIYENHGQINRKIKLIYYNTQTEYTVNFPEETECDILIVGGGGGGGSDGGGGGGGGGVIYATGITVPTSTYTIKVGTGGTSMSNGTQSEALGGIAMGGGHGGGGFNQSTIQATSGGSGGGGGIVASLSSRVGGIAGTNTIGSILNTGIVNNYNGKDGGSCPGRSANYGICLAGGGGGANEAGVEGLNNTYSGVSNTFNDGKGKGGDGIEININGTSYYWAGGGGGGSIDPILPGAGGRGGGGGGAQGFDSVDSPVETYAGSGGLDGYSSAVAPTNTTANSGNGGHGGFGTGSGGGGGGYHFNLNGGNGGSGIVIIRYKTQYQATTHGAQWTYHSANPNTHHYGNVGIGTTASATQKLLVNGDMNVTGNYKQNDNTIGNWYKAGTSIYRASGNVGIGNTAPQYSLHVHGGVYAGEGGTTGDGTTVWTSTSDSRMKDNIFKASYKECYDIFKKIELYRYNFKPGHVNSNDRNQLGFIAQEVQQQIPNSVEPRSIRLSSGVYIHDILTLNVTQVNYILYGTFKYLIAELDIIKKHLESQEEAGQTE